MSKIEVTISQLAKYGLDYVSLISSSGSRSRPVKTDNLDNDLIPINELIFEEDKDSINFDLTTALDGKFDQNISEDEKSEEQRNAERLVNRDREILNKLQEIDVKIKTDGYTKRIVLQTGIISFEAKRLLDNEFSIDNERYEAPLFQIPISSIDFIYSNGGVKVSITIVNNTLEILTGPIKNYLPQNYYDNIFKFIADSESEDKTIIPVEKEFISNLWSVVKVQLERVDAINISESPSFEHSLIAIAPKTNHFLAEDLSAIAAMEDEELINSSLGAWVSDEDMTIEKSVSDDGSTEIFFPFEYDKYQLKVLGITANKAVIVEGPPGTGKSQTISNLLVHLASTGKRVLFASQKDQAIRGVKDKLKTLDIPFLFGYIPDKTSKLYSEEDEKDSASNTLIALNREFQKGNVGDLKSPLSLLSSRHKIYADNLENERSAFKLYEERRQLGYVEPFYKYSLNNDWYKRYIELETSIKDMEDEVGDYENLNGKYIKTLNGKFKNLDIDYEKTLESVDNVHSYFKTNMPERSGWIGGKVNDIKLRNILKEHCREMLQEVYVCIEGILFSDNTKSQRLRMLEELGSFFAYSIKVEALVSCRKELEKMLSEKNMPGDMMLSLKKIIGSNESSEKVFRDLERYEQIAKLLDDLDLYSTNELNREIKDIRKFYKKNITNYARNRILARVDEVNSSKALKATLAQVARSLTKSKKANKTFDRLKHNEDNFMAMSKVLPIWMMSLDDVSRIVPLEMNAFDYVIIDEASQCNFAYAFPAMLRAKHTIFFGDTLQMRDDNIMFKSNDQLNAIAKKHKIPDVYQIKAEEDTVKSVMDIAHLNGFKTTTLKYHYRSPKELIGFSNEAFYEPIGRKLEAINDNIIPFKNTGRVLLNHVVTPDENEEMDSRTNMAEVRKVLELIEDIKSDPILSNKSIAVLTFFNEQAELIRSSVKDEDIKVSIIDGIQGDERDIVIYSLVIKDAHDKRRYVALTGEGGEIRKDIAAGRVNVAFSRARIQVHCVTSLPTELWPSGIWIKKYLEYVDKNGVIMRRHNKSEHVFESNFEMKVYECLSKNLDPEKYVIETQVESLGFRIDVVVKNNGLKLAIECDGPTHFEGGDGQVYVKDDWERQGALEAAGWNFYRISYFDWVEDSSSEEEALLDYINQYFFNDLHGHVKTKIVVDLEKEMVAPNEMQLDAYVTDFSGESVDTGDDLDNSHQQPKYGTKSTKKEFSVDEREVDQDEFEVFLDSNVGNIIKIRYQSPRSGSSRYWREIELSHYDDTYFYTTDNSRGYPIKYRRDRVIDFE